MANSYLGVVTRKGLEMLVSETEHAETFLLRRVSRHGPAETLCCWAVLSNQVVREVWAALHSGHYFQALILLNAEAQCLGTVLPRPAEDDLFTAA